MRRGLYFLCICFEALCTRLFITEDHMNFCGCVSTSVLSGNGCWIHTKQSSREEREDRGCFWQKLQKASVSGMKTKLQRQSWKVGYCCSRGHQNALEPQKERTVSVRGFQVVTANVHPALKHLVVYLHPMYRPTIGYCLRLCVIKGPLVQSPSKDHIHNLTHTHTHQQTPQVPCPYPFGPSLSSALWPKVQLPAPAIFCLKAFSGHQNLICSQTFQVGIDRN